jgi:hypothetical protein
VTPSMATANGALRRTDRDLDALIAQAATRVNPAITDDHLTQRHRDLPERHHDIGDLIAQAEARIKQSLTDLRKHWCVPAPAPDAVPAAASNAAPGTASGRASRDGVGSENRPSHGVACYRPSAAMRRLVEDRDRRCCFPGCRRPVRHCDADHTVPYHRGGATCPCNLAMLCRHHHREKATTSWHVEHLWPGVILWITPAGRWRITAPADRE